MNRPIFSGRFHYGAVAGTFHWLTVVLVIAAYALGPGGSEQQVYSAANDFTREAHETLGFAVAVPTLLRLAWRALSAAPEDRPMPTVMRYAAKISHADREGSGTIERSATPTGRTASDPGCSRIGDRCAPSSGRSAESHQWRRPATSKSAVPRPEAGTGSARSNDALVDTNQTECPGLSEIVN